MDKKALVKRELPNKVLWLRSMQSAVVMIEWARGEWYPASVAVLESKDSRRGYYITLYYSHDQYEEIADLSRDGNALTGDGEITSWRLATSDEVSQFQADQIHNSKPAGVVEC